MSAAKSQATWIDQASDWVTRRFSNEGAVPFSSEQSLLLQEVLKQAFGLFAKEVGETMVDHLATLQVRLRRLEDRLDKNCSTSLEGNDTEANRIAQVTVLQQEATSPDKPKSSRNSRRKERRRRVKNKFAIQRNQLLCMRPRVDTNNVLHTCSWELKECVDTLENSMAGDSGWAQTPWCDVTAGHSFGFSPLYECGGFTADVLAKQCMATKVIQRFWRRTREKRVRCKRMLDEAEVQQCAAVGSPRFAVQSFDEATLQIMQPHVTGNTVAIDTSRMSSQIRDDLGSVSKTKVRKAWYARHGGAHSGVYESYAEAVRNADKGLLKKFFDYEEALQFVERGLQR